MHKKVSGGMLAVVVLVVFAQPVGAHPYPFDKFDDSGQTVCIDPPISCSRAHMHNTTPVCSGTGESYQCKVTYEVTISYVYGPGMCGVVSSPELRWNFSKCTTVVEPIPETSPSMPKTYTGIPEDGQTIEVQAKICLSTDGAPEVKYACESWIPMTIDLPGECE